LREGPVCAPWLPAAARLRLGARKAHVRPCPNRNEGTSRPPRCGVDAGPPSQMRILPRSPFPDVWFTAARFPDAWFAAARFPDGHFAAAKPPRWPFCGGPFPRWLVCSGQTSPMPGLRRPNLPDGRFAPAEAPAAGANYASGKQRAVERNCPARKSAGRRGDRPKDVPASSPRLLPDGHFAAAKSPRCPVCPGRGVRSRRKPRIGKTARNRSKPTESAAVTNRAGTTAPRPRPGRARSPPSR